MDAEKGATSPGLSAELQLLEPDRLLWPGSLVNELNQWAHPSVSLRSKKGLYTQPELLEPALPQAAPLPEISRKEKRDRELRGSNTDRKVKKFTNKFGNTSQISRMAEKASTLSASFSGSYLSADEKKEDESCNFDESLLCHSNSYLVLHGE